MNSNYIFEGAKDEIWCKNLISYAKKNYQPHESAVGFVDGGKVDPNFRKSTLRWLDRNLEHEVKNLIWDTASIANRMAFGVDINYVNDIQFTEYHGDPINPGKYNWHHDIDWNDTKFLQRKLSFVMFLSDPSEYTGGNFSFRDLDINIKQKAGTIIIFPSFYIHQVEPVTSGTRYSLVSWVEGPKWR